MTAALSFVETTLNYVGPIEGRARFDLQNPARTNLAFEPHRVRIHDAQPIRGQLSLDREAFILAEHRSSVAGSEEIRSLNMRRQIAGNAINDAYHAEVGELIRKLTGAREVLPQPSGLIVRTTDRAKKKSWATQASFIHLDFTTLTAEMFLKLAAAETGRTIAPHRRYAVYQTWRAISRPPQDNTLTVCDGGSVPASDAVVMDSIVGPREVPGSVFESRLCRYREGHRWYYFSNMSSDDLLIFKGYDSNVPDAMNAMHTAFDNPAAGPDAVSRESIEARFFALYD